MKRSEINRLIRDASLCFKENGWALPPHPRWDVTDLGLGDWRRFGLVLVNLAEEPEYCEKLMYAKRGMTTPAHTHRLKKEDIICRWGKLRLTVWQGAPGAAEKQPDVTFKVSGTFQTVPSGSELVLQPGERVTLVPGVYHAFVPVSGECIIGEVSTANDDANDNVFADPVIGRFPPIEEDEEPIVRLVSD